MQVVSAKERNFCGYCKVVEICQEIRLEFTGGYDSCWKCFKLLLRNVWLQIRIDIVSQPGERQLKEIITTVSKQDRLQRQKKDIS